MVKMVNFVVCVFTTVIKKERREWDVGRGEGGETVLIS